LYEIKFINQGKEIDDLETKACCLADFILSCMCEPEKNFVEYDALLNAQRQFGLNTEKEILKFIANGGLQTMIFVNTKPWRNNPRKNIGEIFIDSYIFHSNKKEGYIAFYQGPKGNYIIKSFHLDNDKLTLANVGNNSIKPLR